MTLKIDMSDLVEELKEAVREAVKEQVNTQEAKEYFTTSEVREYVGGISIGTLTKWRKHGLKSIVIDGICLFKRTDVIEFVDAHRCT